MADTQSKAEKYRKAFVELGLDVNYGEFAAYLKKHHHLEVPQSTFYAIRKELKKPSGAGESAPVSLPNKPVEQPPVEKPEVRSLPLDELPKLLEQGRGLLARFGGDHEAAVKFIRAL